MPKYDIGWIHTKAAVGHDRVALLLTPIKKWKITTYGSIALGREQSYGGAVSPKELFSMNIENNWALSLLRSIFMGRR